MPSRTVWSRHAAGATLLVAVTGACALGGRRDPARESSNRVNGATAAAVRSEPRVEGAWRVNQIASRAPGEDWSARPGPQAGFYVFSAHHYSYFYVPGIQPRARFSEANRPTEAEKAAAYDGFIAGAGVYAFDGRTLELKADLRKNPNEMTGEVWRWEAAFVGDTLRLVFKDPPFLPGRDWRVTLIRVE